MTFGPKENGGALEERMDQDAVPPNGKKDVAKGNKRKKDEKSKDDDLISMPGMMDTVLNLGLNDEVVRGLAARSGERFAYDSYWRFIDMFGGVVMGVSHSLYEHELESMKDARLVQQDTDLTTEDLKELVQKYKGVYQKAIGKPFPTGVDGKIRQCLLFLHHREQDYRLCQN